MNSQAPGMIGEAVVSSGITKGTQNIIFLLFYFLVESEL